jgi:hypothetical protein
MKPLVFIIPTLVAVGGILCFFLLPMPLGVRLAIMISDLVAAVLIGFVLFRRLGN